MKTNSKPEASLQPRFRLMVGPTIAIGPGKARLLRLVRETGSIAESARRMQMSYMRAWSLIRTMNNCFAEPVMQTTRGGNARGGATLTPSGERLLKLYEALEAQCLANTTTTRRAITALLKSNPA